MASSHFCHVRALEVRALDVTNSQRYNIVRLSACDSVAAVLVPLVDVCNGLMTFRGTALADEP